MERSDIEIERILGEKANESNEDNYEAYRMKLYCKDT